MSSLDLPSDGTDPWGDQIRAAFDTLNTEKLEVTSLGTTEARAVLDPLYANISGIARVPVADSGPYFTKYSGNPILAATTAFSPRTMMWPQMVYVPDLNPTQPFYLYTSSDHGSLTYGIELHTSATPLGPFTYRGVVYSDTSGNGQTEEPTIFRNPITGQLHMLCQNSDTVQWIALCKSSNGINWTKFGKVIELAGGEIAQYPGSGHCGYPRVQVVGDMLIARHNIGGGLYQPPIGTSYSLDWGETWQLDPRPSFGQEDQVTAEGDLISSDWQPFRWNGEWWVVTFKAGPGNVGAKSIVARLSDDLRHLASRPRVIIELDQAWELANPAAPAQVGGHPFLHEGKLYFYYVCDHKVGVTIAEVN